MIYTTGEYIINVDPDDLLNGNDALEYIFNIAIKYKVDIINFGYLNGDKFDLKCSNFRRILRQPALFEKAFNSYDYIINDYLLWNKMVKRKIMLKAYESFKNQIYNEKWNYGEDTIWSILINKYAKSMFCINKLIYIYNSNFDSLMKNQNNTLRIKDKFKFEEMYRKILIKKKEKKYIIANIKGFINDFNIYNNSFSLMKSKVDIKNKLINLLKIYTQEYHISYDVIINFINSIIIY